MGLNIGPVTYATSLKEAADSDRELKYLTLFAVTMGKQHQAVLNFAVSEGVQPSQLYHAYISRKAPMRIKLAQEDYDEMHAMRVAKDWKNPRFKAIVRKYKAACIKHVDKVIYPRFLKSEQFNILKWVMVCGDDVNGRDPKAKAMTKAKSTLNLKKEDNLKVLEELLWAYVWGNSSVVTACEKKLANQGRWGPFRKLHVVNALKKAKVIRV
ncbi:MAG: hypothetical protein AB8B85_21315 [Paracoccaceae bacterium]